MTKNTEINPDYYLKPSTMGSPLLLLLLDLDVILDDECITLIRHEELHNNSSFYRCSAIKYLWRLGEKGDQIIDLKKTIKYLDWEYESNKNANQVRAVARCLSACRQLLFQLKNN